jgi:hypothetical protein
MPITLHEAAEIEQNEIRTRSNERDEFQVMVDGDVARLKDAWMKAKTPAPGPKSPSHRYVVEKGDRAELKNVVRRAARLHEVTVTFYKDAVTQDGLYQVKFNLSPLPTESE